MAPSCKYEEHQMHVWFVFVSKSPSFMHILHAKAKEAHDNHYWRSKVFIQEQCLSWDNGLFSISIEAKPVQGFEAIGK